MSLAVLGLVASLLVFAIPVAVIVLVVRAARSRDGDAERTSWSLRRFLQYGFMLATLFVSATGLVLLLSYALPEGPRLAGRATTDLALGLALVLVAGPAWGLLWRMVSRQLVAEETERASLAYSLYLTAASTVSLIVALVGLVSLGTWALTAGDFDAPAAASGIVYAAAWALHAWLARHRSWGAQGPLAQLVGLTGSAVGVVALGIGVAGILYFGFQEVYEAVAGAGVLGDASALPETLRRDLVLAVLAGAVWWWHWLREASRGPYETLWRLYVMLVPILGGLLTATVSAGIVLHTVVSWLLGVPESQRASAHFDVLPGALAAAAVGIWAWWYHRWVLSERTGEPGAERAEAEPDRAYRYLVGAVGLLAAAAGLAVALVTVIQVLAPAPLAADDPRGRETFSVAITLLVVGVPLWGVFWRGLQQRAHARTAEEVASPSRRAYLFLLFGASALAAISSLVVILYVLLRDLLDTRLSTEVLYELRVALAIAVTAGALAGYHWAVYREDREAGASHARVSRTVLLVTSHGAPAAGQLAARTGATVRTLHRLDGIEPAWDPDGVAAAVLASPHERVLVLAGEGGISVIPYEPA